MKRKAIALVLYLCALVLYAPFALAQTADGQTPANEGVCDVLQADGVTSGLYGLCVAFCEAQDHASLDNPITNDQLEELESASPSGQILANYNRKKTDTDPDMPCIKIQEPCPCWTADELASIDGILYDGSQASTVYCDIRTDFSVPRITVYEYNNCTGGLCRYSLASTWDDQRGGRRARTYCRWANVHNNNEGTITLRQLFVPNDITYEEFAACETEIDNHIASIQSSCTAGNQAP